MGQSTDGMLWYGFAFTEEDAPPWAKFDDEYDRIDDGVQDDDADQRLDRLLGNAGKSWEERKAAREVIGCEVVMHCSGECTMYGVAVSASYKNASRGYPTQVAEVILAAHPDWNEKLRTYCELMGIDPVDQEPGWWLASWWG